MIIPMPTATARKHQSTAASTTIDRVSEELGLSYSELGDVIGGDRRTIYRWRSRESVPSPEHRKRLESVRELQFLLGKVFEDSDRALEWLHRPVPMLRGRTPISRLREGRIEEVLGVLAGLESGAHA